MSLRRAAPTRVAALVSGAVLLAGCASGGAHQARPAPAAAKSVTSPPAPTSAPVVTPSPTPRPKPKPKPVKAVKPDALGAKRVIPVPTSLADQQEHRLLAVDDQVTLLDSGPDGTPRPLLLVLHGLGETALEMRQQTGFTALAALDGFDVAYPNAPQDPAFVTTAAVEAPEAMPAAALSPTPSVTPSATPAPSPTASPSPSRTVTPAPSRPPSPRPTPKPTPSATPSPTPSPSKRPSPLVAGTRAWNAGICCALALRNDVGYLVDVVHAVEASVPVDTTRVYVVGFSNGGMMALRAICSAPFVFAAAGSVSGPFLGTTCDRPIWRHIAAATDPVVPVLGGIAPGAPAFGIARDWCGCDWPATTSEQARFGPFVSVYISPTGGHTWPTPTSSNWDFDPERDLWGYVSRFHF
jgi:poly(3-hydroxybutyrate) depolymerase